MQAGGREEQLNGGNLPGSCSKAPFDDTKIFSTGRSASCSAGKITVAALAAFLM
jgi:hypothetical protein